jgi:lysophospholipase L1-like esterase
MPVRRTAVAAALLATAACLTACSSDEAGPAPDAPAHPTYVALGDSYTAAPGVPTQDALAGCSQSDSNYPHLLAAQYGATLVDVSCSGADTTSITGPQTVTGGSRPPQLDAVTADTDVVTVGIGGNDANLFTTIIGSCLGVASQAPQGAPCRAKFTAGGTDQLRQTVRRTGRKVQAVLEQVAAKAPDAQVLAVGYPQPVPAFGTCPLLPLATGDYAYARSVLRALDAAIERAADAAGATYVDVAGPSQGHDICAGDQAWVSGLFGAAGRAAPFHPFEAEQQAVAGLVAAQLQG